MVEAIQAYRGISIDEEFRSLEWLKRKREHDEAQALGNARRKRDEHWRGIVAGKDATIASKDAALAEQSALIAELRAQINKK